MMKGIIRKGDKTSSGGVVLAGSGTKKFRGIPVARKGDPVSCPVPGHGPTHIAEGHSAYKDQGLPVAFEGHVCACGCALISSLSDVKAQ